MSLLLLVAFVTVALLIRDILCASLSLSLCVFFFASLIRGFFSNIDCLVIFRIDVLVHPQQLVLERWMFSFPLPAAIPTFGTNILFFFGLHLKKQKREKKKERTRFASYCVKSSLGVSQPVVLYFL